ncbi:unnamed protein product [Boreogadus saida]
MDTVETPCGTPGRVQAPNPLSSVVTAPFYFQQPSGSASSAFSGYAPDTCPATTATAVPALAPAAYSLSQLYQSSFRMRLPRLSGCLVTQEGCASLASALSSNPSHLRALDLSYNHPGDSGAALLSAGLEDPRWRLDTLSVEHGGVWRLKPALKKYACDLTLDPNTAHRLLSLSEDNRKVTWVAEDQSYPDHPDRFDSHDQVLGREALTGRCYWEVEWEGRVEIGVTYRGITRRGGGGDSRLGGNNKSWSLYCSGGGYSALYNGTETFLPLHPAGSTRVGVYLDRPAGSLSFYSVSPGGGGSSDTLTHIHTFWLLLHPGGTSSRGSGVGVGGYGGWSSASLSRCRKNKNWAPGPVQWRLLWKNGGHSPVGGVRASGLCVGL